MRPPRQVFPRLRPRVQPLPVANDLRHDLRGCDVGATFVVSVHPPQQAPQLPRQVQVAAPAQAPVSPGGAIRQLELSPERRAGRPAHYRRTSAAKAQARWSLL